VQGVITLEPKPIDSRHLLDIDAGRRIIDMEGFVREVRQAPPRRQHPAESTNDVIRDETGRHSRPEQARVFADHFRRATEDREEQPPESAEGMYKRIRISPESQKGAHLDIEA
jgi:hypothetical protein